MATITKRELSLRITEKVATKNIEISQQEITEIIQTFIDEITDALAHGDNVVMRKFGTFEVREMKAKLGRNPKNPTATVKIPARVGVKFKPGKELKDKVAGSLKLVRERRRTPSPSPASPASRAVKVVRKPTKKKAASPAASAK